MDNRDEVVTFFGLPKWLVWGFPFEGALQTVVEKHLGLEPGQLPDKELMGIVIRLNRTGCYTMMGWRKNPAKDCRLTDIYFKLKRLIFDADETASNNQMQATQ